MLVVAALLGVMLIAGSLKRVGVSSAATLAAIGFVLLTAYAVAELGKSFSLPLVTGYILAGVVLGPSVGGIISGEVVREMRMFNTLALGLIATSAGLELDLRQLRRLGKTLLLTTFVKVVVGVSLVTATLFAVESSLGLLGISTRTELAVLALIMGVLSLGTSPSITLAVLSETKAKGRLSDLVLGAAVFKDLVVIVGLAVAVAVGRSALEPAASLDQAVLAGVAFELAGSIIAGSLVGLVLIAYVRFIGAEMLLFVAAMILVVAELCRAFHLELLLVFIVAGFVVRNYSKFGHDLMRPLELVALPVFVVFFANAGASIDLTTMWKILPLALAVGAARAFAYYLASRLGGKWAGESPLIQREAWWAYLPQAGVTLGLVGLASLQLPQLGTSITNTGMAVVALNLLLGPVTLRRALGRAGELPAPAIGQPAALAPEISSGRAGSTSEPAQLAAAQVSVGALPEAARRAYAGVLEATLDVLSRFENTIGPGLPVLPVLSEEVPDLQLFRELVVGHRSAYQALYADLTSVLGQLPRLLRLDPRPGMQLEPGKLTQRLLRGGRELPLRRLARIALDPAIARYVASSFESGLRGRPLTKPSVALTGRMQTGGHELPPELESGLAQFARLLRDAGTRRLPTRRLRYSSVESSVRRQLRSLSGATEIELARLACAAWGSQLLELERARVTGALRGVVSSCVVAPAVSTMAKVGPAVSLLSDWIKRSGHALDGASSPVAAAQLRADFDSLATSALAELSREFRFAATVRTTLLEMQASIAALPASVDCLFLEQNAPLQQAKVQSVPLRAHAEALIRHLLPPVDLAARSVSTALSQVPRRVEDAIGPDWELLETQRNELGLQQIRALVSERFARSRRRVERVADVTARAVQAALEALAVSLDSACAAFTAEVLAGPAAPRGRDAGLAHHIGRARRALSRRSSELRLSLFGPASLLDASAVRRALHVRRPAELPDAVQRWFDGAPVSDERSFVAHRNLLDGILDAESSRAETGHASVLIVGSKGAGKSSLLNMCELELPFAHQLRLHAADFGADTSLFEALATLLDCPATPAALGRQLTLHSSAIFVDDLSTWVCSSLDRQRELQRVLRLIAETHRDAFWLISIEASMLRLLNELDSVEEVFTHVVRLPPLSLPEVRRLVESRLELSNLEVAVQLTRHARLLDRVWPSREGERMYRALRATSDGVPARVVALCRSAFHVDGKKVTLSVDAVRAPKPPRFDFSQVQLALLAALQRYGPQTLPRLERELALPSQRLQRSLAFLIACGLVNQVDEGHAFSIPSSAEWVVLEMLVGARVVAS
ncbi:MAG: cation:proton antiporter [Deltaproteobacteria bacterium]